MKTIEELEVFLSERVSEKAEKIKECKENIQKSDQEIEKANAYLLDAESKETPNAYQTAKDALWGASNAKEFYTKQLEKLKNSSLLTEQEWQEAGDILKGYLLKTNREQYQEAAELMDQLKAISDRSNEFATKCETLSDLIGYPLPRVDYARAFYAQVVELVPMYPIIIESKGE
ncbi:hypothetical protein [uncultured Trichococcus sp.]|uniref:hypothetical protein n=1 Tax=uncultured Trichococcus sp. TaxID=189665 RepID=UPI002A18E1EE|nr:hypothetical protein [uncultured Trichococcus sp.]